MHKQTKQGIYSPLPMSRQVLAIPRRAGLNPVLAGTWEDKCHNAACLPVPSSTSLLAERDVVVSGGDFGSAVPAVSPAHASHGAAAGRGAGQAAPRCVRAAQHGLERHRALLQPTMEKMNSARVQTSVV